VRSIIILILVGIVSAAAAGCGESESSKGREKVVASFYPLAFAAEEIGESKVDVANLTPAGTEPHDLEVTPADVKEIRTADLVLLLGHDFQPQLEEAAGGGDNVLRLLDTPGLKRFSNDDPHVWLDPLRFALLAERIGSALHAPRPAEGFATRLRALDDEYRRGLAHCRRREIVTSHEAFAYLSERYGLRQIAITGLSPEAEPSPKSLGNIVDQVRKTGATTVFFETLVSPRIAETVARETGAAAAVLNPIEGLTPDESKQGENYFSVMRSNLASLRSALGCR
jgi:zinc transport system substrate-binding protein